MAPLRTADVPRGRAIVYLRRAEQLMKAVDWGIEQGHASVAAVNAVQASISAVDAFLVHHLGKRSRGTDHRESLNLLASASSPARRAIGQHLQRVLDRKNEVEYLDRAVTLGDANELAKHARRLVDTVRNELEG
ncbi:MAG: HEPN domain-containing protein [Thermoplasmata archaeon]|jgi:HEPN domain-containing protein|nr:HEPN domain-containing protein [Thermoplasmata archaeon]